MLEHNKALADVQSSPDFREIAVDRVGVKGVKHPIFVPEKSGRVQATTGTFTLLVDLPKEVRGAHMSRFLEVLGEHTGGDFAPMNRNSVASILNDLRARLKSNSARLEVRFTFFRQKVAPVSGSVGMMAYECGFTGNTDIEDEFQILVTCPVATLCPCSKAISDVGAHNQRGYVSVSITPSPEAAGGEIWLEDVIDMIEQSGSAPLYPVLKRVDEKFVTEQAYRNPRFVEDVVREIALRFDRTDSIKAYRIEVENHESIHDHNAYAFLERVKF